MAETVTIERVYSELKNIERKMVTKEEIESLIETFEILSNPVTMKSLKKSLAELDAGKGLQPIKRVEELL